MSMALWKKLAPRRRSLVEALGEPVEFQEVLALIDEVSMGLSQAAVRETAAFFNFKTLDEGFSWKVRGPIYDAIVMASAKPGVKLSGLPAAAELVARHVPGNEKITISQPVVSVLKDCFARARAWDNGKSISGWEEDRADKLISSLRRIAKDDPDFFDFLPGHPHLYSPTLKDAAIDIRDHQKMDPEMSSSDTEGDLRSMITLIAGKQPDARRQLADLTSILRQAEEDIDTKSDPRWVSMIEMLEGVLGRLLPLKEHVTKSILHEIAWSADGLPPTGVSPVFVHFMKFGKLSNVVTGTQATDCLLKLKRIFDADREVFDEMLSQWNDAVDRAIVELKRMTDTPPEYSDRAVDPPYGKFLFAKKRHDDVPPEEDTHKESGAYLALKGHIQNNEVLPQHVALDLMGQLEDGSYGAVLKEPTVEYVYRGMKLPADRLAKMLGVDVSSLQDNGSMVLDRMMKTRRGGEGSTSWSIDFNSGRSFSWSGNGDEWGVLFVAKVSENPQSFLQGPNGFYKVMGLDSFTSEKEAIALGPIRVYKAYWEHKTDSSGVGSNVDVKEQNAVSEGVSLLRSYIRRLLA